jgi:succinyl-diaminopimelate desuccinylase
MATMNSVTELTQNLVRRASITPKDDGCQNYLAELLEQNGFQIEHKQFEDVDNLLAWHGNDDSDTSLLFVGHTDVVPTGDPKEWKHPPFSANIEDDFIYGRGTADMKGSVAAMTLAMIEFAKSNPKHKGKIALMLTSDEEGIAINGIKKMMPHIAKSHQFTHCIVGEPSSSKTLGDVVRIGRRGSLHVEITIIGKQGHVAYPEKAKNPVFLSADLIKELSGFQWDNGNEDFPPTSFQISSVKTSTNTSNIIPGEMIINGNFRFSPELDETQIELLTQNLLTKLKLDYKLKWNLSGLPFHSKCRRLKTALQQSIQTETGLIPTFNAGGGTSDGRFVAPYGIEVVELGPVNATIHQINEKVSISELEKLKTIYLKTMSLLIK